MEGALQRRAKQGFCAQPSLTTCNKTLAFRAKSELLQAPLHHRKTAEPQRVPLGEHVKAGRISAVQGVEPCHGRCSAEACQAGFLRSIVPVNMSQKRGSFVRSQSCFKHLCTEKNRRTSKGTLRGACQDRANFHDARGRPMPWKVLCRGVPRSSLPLQEYTCRGPLRRQKKYTCRGPLCRPERIPAEVLSAHPG